MPSHHRRSDFQAGFLAWVAGLANEFNYGLIAFSPLLVLGTAQAWHGLVAALLSAIVANLAMLSCGGRPAVTTGGRPMLSILMATLIGSLLVLPGMREAGAGTVLVFCSLCLLLSGLSQAAFGLLNIGQLVKYIPYPVFSGFALAAALMLLGKAWRPLLGLPMTPLFDGSSPAGLPALFAQCHPLSLLVGSVTILCGLFSHHWSRQLPGLIVAFALGMLLDLALRSVFPAALGPTLPALHGGMPDFPMAHVETLFALPDATVGQALTLVLTTALSLAVIGSLETLISNAALDTRLSTRSDANRQLLANGVGNFFAALFAGIPCAPSVSRSLLIAAHGGRTHRVTLIYVLLFAIVLIYPTPLSLASEAVLAGLMCLVALSLVDREILRLGRQALSFGGSARHLAAGVRTQSRENTLIVVSVGTVGVTLGLIEAIVSGIVISTILFLQHNRREVIRRVVPGTLSRSRRVRDQATNHLLAEHGHLTAIIEVQGPLYFATADRLIAELERLAEGSRWLIVDCRRLTHLDTTGAHLLSQFVRCSERRGCVLHLSYVAPDSELGQSLRNLHLHEALPLKRWHPDTDHALETCENELLATLASALSQPSRSLSLLETDLCRDMPTGAEQLLATHLQRREIAAGTLLFRQGDAGHSLFVVTRGEISLILNLGAPPGNSKMRLATYTPGVVFGEMAFLENRTRSADALAETDIEVYELSRHSLSAIEAVSAAVASQLLINIGVTLSQRLRVRNAEMAELEKM